MSQIPTQAEFARSVNNLANLIYFEQNKDRLFRLIQDEQIRRGLAVDVQVVGSKTTELGKGEKR